MALSLSAIRDALADQINDALQVSSRAANVYPYPPDSPELHAVLIRPRAGSGEYVQFHQSFSSNVQGDGALAGILLEIEVRAGGSDIDAARAMDDYLSTATDCSIINAVEADRTLGGVIEDCWIRAVSAPVRFFGDNREWLSATFELEAYERR